MTQVLTEKFTRQEVAEIFRMAIRGDVAVSLDNPVETWDTVYAGYVRFLFGDWLVTFFNDCNALDFTEHVIGPSGKRWDYYADDEPLDILTDAEVVALERLLNSAV